MLKPSSHIVFSGILWYSTVLQYPRATIWKHSDQILNTGKYPQYRQILGIANRTRFYSQYRELATIWERIRHRWIPLATLNTQIIFFLNVFLRRTRSSNKRWRPQTIYKIQIYRQLLLATGYLMGFGSPTSNTEYCQISPNTIWELAFILLKKVKCQWTVKGPQPFPCHVSLFKFNIKFAKT